MLRVFSYLSSEVDWCEANFEHSEYIAEYYNTISNVAFFLLAPTMLWLNTDYIAYRPTPIRGFVILQIFIGFFSLYYHMTLSYAGQLLDELSILWTMCISYAFWFPVRYFPGFIKNRDQFITFVAMVTVTSTFMSFVKPALNAYVLNCVAFHLLYLAYQEVRRCSSPAVRRAAVTMTFWWVIAISCWLVDKFFCSFCQKLNFCYLHSFWHVFINIALLHCITLILFFDIYHDLPSSEPAMEFWPSNTFPITLPYVTVRKPLKWC
ncbi:alkaline ceramidase 1 [Python bivittatus]|uniref:Alkaline ceramidase n=1 Tax=Python bivittatus TaxID=176946 RepID=A0A9F2REQ1_PYTBI|nr:alkaline ceramidase 1 [Python bivittatus]XP_025032567.1 alkaline ceramidase 1 [Python bivittatus]